MENITLPYPSWFILLCILLGLAYAVILYYRDRSFGEQSKRVNWIMGGIRFLSVTLLSVLLLSPLIKSRDIESREPIVIFAHDASESVVDQLEEEQIEELQTAFDQLAGELEGDYELKRFAFGAEIREGWDFTFPDKVTNMADFFTGMYDRYSNQNLGALILATDGIYNEGSNPLYLNTDLNVPLYTVALGDTTPRRDVVLRRAFHNRIAYLGDKFSVQVDIAAQNSAGSNTALNVYEVEGDNLRRIQQKAISIEGNDFFRTEEVVLEAAESGVRRYRLSLSPLEREVTTANNSKDIFVDVLDARQKILLVAQVPHPDITALRQIVTSNRNYDFDLTYIDNFDVNVAEYDFVIFHQLPGYTQPISGLLSRLEELGTSHLFIAGTQTDFRRLNQAQNLVDMQVDTRSTNDVQAKVSEVFNLFTLEESTINELPNYAPLLAPFGDFSVGDGSVLLYQRIGKVDTQYPLLVLGDKEDYKVGILLAEGIWKWRLFDYLQHKNHELVDGLFSKIIQYLSIVEDRRRFRVDLDKNIFNENENILFDAELYNESYELVNDPDVSLTIRNEEGNEFNFTFDKRGQAYRLNAGKLPVGNYAFSASVMLNGEALTYDGQFSVRPIQLEVYETTADHRLLRLLSEKYGGQLVYPDELEQLPELLAGRESMKAVVYETVSTRSVINIKWVFFLLLVLLTTEWFLRRYFGGY
ncbi:MAG: hypothetical protein R3350_00955 [Saprospiraceae bacterium]|nr:hypothetical protein [Saprospiraceae bacterium]